jgi:multiple sugar transport system ATP-binding protein
MNFIKAEVRQVYPHMVAVEVGGEALRLAVQAESLGPGDVVTLGVRPEHMSGGGDGVRIGGTVDAVERLGDASYVYMRLADATPVIARLPGDTPVQPGEGFTARPDAAAIHLFDPAGQAIPRVTIPA